TLTVEGAPKVLLLLLNRFSDITGAKVDRQVSYPESLDLQPYLSQPNRGPLPYALCAVLVHAGVTCLSGHYFCYVRSGDGQWYKMDDSKVTRCEVTSVLTDTAYVLFYVQEAHLSKDRIGGQVGKGQEAQVLERGPKKKLHRGSGAKAQEPHRDLEHRAIREISLDQWKVLQEDSHPNLPMKLRRVEPALPADAVVIHQARHGGDRPRNGPHKENYPCPNPVGFLPAHGARSTGELCSHGETSRPGTKKKKRKNKP
ncbi:ubiquitin carboxyl-terminal hydrolase 17 A, partial [Sigmodon hispidus]